MSGAHLPETASLRLEVARVLQNSQNGIKHPALQGKTGYSFYRMTKSRKNLEISQILSAFLPCDHS